MTRDHRRRIALLMLACVVIVIPTICVLVDRILPLRPDFNPPPPIPRGKIAFVSDRDGNREIYTIDSTGDNLTRITNDPAQDHNPDWSPDGSKILFESIRAGGQFDLYTITSDGSNLIRLTDCPRGCTDGAWSPDGAEIAYAAHDQYGNPSLFIMNADGTNPRQITNDQGLDYAPSWSPDGTKIVFEREIIDWPDRYFAIYVVNADGSNLSMLYDSQEWDRDPVWSPDGTKIAFLSIQDGYSQLFTMQSDGSDVKRLTYLDDAVSVFYPSWSPDGRYISLTISAVARDIYLFPVEQGEAIYLTNDNAAEFFTDWSPIP
jgi:Tol biopolymer transport system component